MFIFVFIINDKCILWNKWRYSFTYMCIFWLYLLPIYFTQLCSLIRALWRCIIWYVFYVNLSQKSNLRSLWFFLSLLWYLFCISEYRILRSVKYCFLECDIYERFMCLHRHMLKILKTGDNNHTVSTMNDEHCKAVFMYMFY